MSVARRMTVLRVTVPGQYFCTKHPDLNITENEKIIQEPWFLLAEKYSPLQNIPKFKMGH